MSFGILYLLVSWSKVKHVAINSGGSHISELHQFTGLDLSDLCHAVIREYDRCCNIPTSSTSIREWQLQMILPDFYNLNKSIGSFLSSKRSCCSIATCIYVKTASLHPPIAETEYLRHLHADNHSYRIQRRKRNTRARRAARADEDVRAAERSRDRSQRRGREGCSCRRGREGCREVSRQLNTSSKTP
jgi:hypothetical protein